jgi:hypothetical protein
VTIDGKLHIRKKPKKQKQKHWTCTPQQKVSPRKGKDTHSVFDCVSCTFHKAAQRGTQKGGIDIEMAHSGLG